MTVTTSSFHQAREVLQASMEKKAVQAQSQQELQLIASTRHQEREQTYHKEAVGRHLNERV